jgi:hypothetical protein
LANKTRCGDVAMWNSESVLKVYMGVATKKTCIFESIRRLKL